MPTPGRPADTKTFGRHNTGIVLPGANLLTPLLTELNAATGLDVTNMYFRDGTSWPEPETTTVDAPPRGGDTETFSSIGPTNQGSGTLIYQDSPQLTGNDDNKLRALLPEFARRWLWHRVGKPIATDLTAGDVVHVMLVEFGRSYPAQGGEAASGTAAARATFTVLERADWRPIVTS